MADRTVTLIWNSNTESDLKGYNVYQRTVLSSYKKGKNIKATTNKSEYKLKIPNTGIYFWVVTSIDNSDNESGFSNEVSSIFWWISDNGDETHLIPYIAYDETFSTHQ